MKEKARMNMRSEEKGRKKREMIKEGRKGVDEGRGREGSTGGRSRMTSKGKEKGRKGREKIKEDD